MRKDMRTYSPLQYTILGIDYMIKLYFNVLLI